MKLKQYLDTLNAMVDENPKLLEFDVVYSEDDEGNRFNNVYFSPTIGVFLEDDFISENDLGDYNFLKKDLNSICIN